MTEDLKSLAELALAQAQEELTKSGGMTPTFIVREGDGETLAVIRLDGKAGRLMNHGKAKDAIFGGDAADGAGAKSNRRSVRLRGVDGKADAEGRGAAARRVPAADAGARV